MTFKLLLIDRVSFSSVSFFEAGGHLFKTLESFFFFVKYGYFLPLNFS